MARQNAVSVVGSANDRWLEATSTPPVFGMFPEPRTRNRVVWTRNCQTTSIAKLYQAPR